MTFPSTAGNPRLSSSPTALTSLGAVGGPRGAGAGALRIFVEFLSTYDKKATEELENDLRQLDHAANNSAIAEQKRQGRLLAVRNSINESEKIRVGLLDSAQRTQLKQIEALTSSRTKAHRTEGAALKAAFDAALLSSGLAQKDIDLLHQRGALKKAEAVLVARNAAGDATQVRLAKERLATEERIAKVQTGRASLGPKLGGLALGLIGGAVGAGLIGGAFTIIGEVIDQVGQKIQDIIDPSHRAREALVDVSKSILQIAESGGLTVLEATNQYLEQIGISADKAAASLLAAAVVEEQLRLNIEAQATAAEIAAASTERLTQIRHEAIRAIILEAVAAGKLGKEWIAYANNVDNAKISVDLMIDGVNVEVLATERLNSTLDYAAGASFRLKAAQDALALTAARTALAQELLGAALQRATAASVTPIQNQLSNLEVTPSRRTRRLERAVNAGGGGGSGISSQLQNIAEERQLILLRQRLRLLGTAINLERYSGKFLLEAINAKIAALQKENKEQDRLNQLLDLQYRMSQTLRRNQGESISDFLGRRAQENRNLLSEQDDLERQRQIDRLEEKRARVQDEVALAELAEQRKNAIAGAGAATRSKLLQKELEASRKHDKEVYEAKKKALEAQLKAEQEKNKNIEAILQDSVINQTKTLIRGASNLQDLAALQGRIQGYKQAKATIQGLVQAFGLPSFIAAPFLEKIDALLNAYYRKRANLVGSLPGRSNTTPLAAGGVVTLSNASSMFGGNIRLGEEGSELGVVLSHRVAAILQKQKGGPGQIGPFYLQASGDMLRDKYMLGRTVKEAISEALA